MITFIENHKGSVIGILLLSIVGGSVSGIFSVKYEGSTQASKDQETRNEIEETRNEIEEFFNEYGLASKSAFNSGDYNEISSFITENEEGTYGYEMVKFTKRQLGNRVHKKVRFFLNSVKKETDSVYTVIVDERYISYNLKKKECKNQLYTNREYTLKKMKNNELKIESLDKSNEKSIEGTCKE